MGAVLSLRMHRRRPVQFAEHHAGGALQVQAAGRAQREAEQVGLSLHEIVGGLFLLFVRLPAGDEAGAQRLEFLLVNVHHRVVVPHEQHLLPRLHQRAHERGHEGGLGDARGLPLALADGVLDQRPARGVVRGAQKAQLFGHGGHQFAVDFVVPVDLLHEAALGGELFEHIPLDAAQHQPLAAQVLAQQLRLGHHRGIVAIAPLAGKALPIAEEMEVEDIDHVPDLAALVVDGRAGQADDVFARLRQQAGRGILARAVAPQFLHLVKNDGAEALLGQDVLPAAQKQVVDDVNVRLGQLVGREAMNDMHAQSPVRREKALKLPLPVANEVRRHHEDGRIGRGGGEKRQRLHGLAQAHLVGQQAAAGGEQKRQPLLLEIQQFA